MKFILSIIALCVIQTTYAQKVINKSYLADQVTEVKVDTDYADIELETYNGNEIIIEASVNINLNMDNEAYTFEAERKGNTFIISSELDTDNIPKRVILKDKKGNITVINDGAIENIGSKKDEYTSINYGYQTDITLKIKVPQSKNIRIGSIYGDLVANGKYNDVKAKITYGDIEIIQSEVSHTSSIDLHSTYGHVDYSVPKSADIEFNLSTSYGEIMTDLDVSSADKDPFASTSCGTGRGGKYILNQGKAIAHIKATYDDIYLRGN